MAPRKSRTRKTAERMAKYKQQAERNNESDNTRARRSPRGMNSDKKNQKSNARCSTPDESVPSSPIVDGNDNSAQNVHTGSGTSDIDLDMFVPETPMQSPQVIGRKRAFAARPLDLEVEDEEDIGAGGSQESKVPSKKRKEFQTPPRSDGTMNASEPTGKFGLVPDYDPTLMPPVPRSLWNERDPVTTGFNTSKMLSPLPFSQVTQANSDPKTNGRGHNWAHIRSRLDRHPDSFGQKPASADIRELNLISSYSETLSRQFEVMKKKIQDEICDLHRGQLAEMREMHESLSTSLMSEIQDVKAVMDNLLSRSSRPSSGKIASKTSLAEWEKKLDDLTPHAKLIFSREVFARILSYNVPSKALEVYGNVLNKEGRSSYVLGASIAVQSLIFSLQPKEKKKHFSEGVGRLHSEFKYSVVQNVFYNVCKDTFDQFRSPLVSPDSSRESTENLSLSQDGKNRISRPEWLDAGFVSIPHIDNARAFVESPNQSRRSKVRGTPSPDDIAFHGALRVYRLLGAHLHDGREYVRYTFFQSLGYLFVTWKDYVPDTDQSTLNMSFREDADFVLHIDDIPDTELCSLLANRHRSEVVDAGNMKALKNLFAEYPSLVLEVQHEVHVVSSSGSQRRHSGGDKRILRKYINLIEVACDVLVEFTRVKNVDLFLRTQKNALKCVMIFAIVFKELCGAFMDLRRSSISMMPKTEDLKVCGITLKDLIPGPNSQGSVLESRCLRLTESEFEKFNHRDELLEVNRREDAERAFHLSRIQESVEQGVATI